MYATPIFFFLLGLGLMLINFSHALPALDQYGKEQEALDLDSGLAFERLKRGNLLSYYFITLVYGFEWKHPGKVYFLNRLLINFLLLWKMIVSKDRIDFLDTVDSECRRQDEAYIKCTIKYTKLGVSTEGIPNFCPPVSKRCECQNALWLIERGALKVTPEKKKELEDECHN